MKLSSLGYLALGASFLVLGGHEAAAQPVDYHLVKTIPLPQAPGNVEYFDYITVDADARRVEIGQRDVVRARKTEGRDRALRTL